MVVEGVVVVVVVVDIPIRSLVLRIPSAAESVRPSPCNYYWAYSTQLHRPSLLGGDIRYRDMDYAEEPTPQIIHRITD